MRLKYNVNRPPVLSAPGEVWTMCVATSAKDGFGGGPSAGADDLPPPRRLDVAQRPMSSDDLRHGERAGFEAEGLGDERKEYPLADDWHAEPSRVFGEDGER